MASSTHVASVSGRFWLRSPDSEVPFLVPSFISDSAVPENTRFLLAIFGYLFKRPPLVVETLGSAPSPATTSVPDSYFWTDMVAE